MNPVFLATGEEELLDWMNPYVAGKWYFWNEVWADSYGPYNTEQEAEEACNRYAENI